MGTVAGIGFQAGESFLHRLDPRTKQLLILGLSIASLNGSLTFLALTSVAVLVAIHRARLRFSSILYEIRFFLFFLLLIFLTRMLSFNHWIPVLPTVESFVNTLVVCWRLLLIVLMCLLLMATTRTTAIRAALIRMLERVPLINEKIIGTMVGLLVRFLPLILLQARETGDAMRARCIERQKNPIKRLVKFAIPLFRRVFLRADELVDTMQARCYNDQRTLPELTFTRLDYFAAGIGVLLAVTSVFP